LLEEDRKIRGLVGRNLRDAAISKVEIERFPPNQVRVTIHSAKPGIIIGRKGANVNALRSELQELTGKRVKLDIAEIEHPELDAKLVAESIAEQLERRISHKRAMKQAMLRAIRAGAKGCMIRTGGRLSGAEMARVETVREGQVPRHTLRAEIDYARGEALTTFGRIGIKVWIYKGEHLPGQS
jgi:small subunit ribosomal protein S3